MPNQKTQKALAFSAIVLGTAIPLLILGFALKAVVFSESRAIFENLVIIAGLVMLLWWGIKFVKTKGKNAR